MGEIYFTPWGHDFLFLFLLFQSFESHVKNFYFSLCACWKHRDRHLSCRNAIQFSWRILMQTYQPGLRKLPLLMCGAFRFGGFQSLYKSILFWHWQKIFLMPCIKKRSNSKTLNKPSKEKKIVLIANFEIIPWKRSCCILSALLPFLLLDRGSVDIHVSIVQESVVQTSMNYPLRDNLKQSPFLS